MNYSPDLSKVYFKTAMGYLLTEAGLVIIMLILYFNVSYWAAVLFVPIFGCHVMFDYYMDLMTDETVRRHSLD